MYNYKPVTLAFLFFAILISCNQSTNSSHTESSLPEGKKFIDPSNIDTTINPADDFYTYANGAWMKNTPIPASETRWGSFNLLEDFNKNALKKIVEDAAKNPGKMGSPSQRVGDLFASGMDTASIDKLGINAIKDQLDKINAINTPADLIQEITREQNIGLNPLFGFYVSPDDKNVTKQICNLWQGGIGLPDRDYYFKTDEKGKKILDAYKTHIANMLKLAGTDNTNITKISNEIFSLESTLAKASMTRVEMRDPYKLYNKFSLANLSAQTIGLDWKQLFANMNVNTEDTVICAQPAFFKTLASLIKSVPINTWKNYLTWHLVSNMSPYLSNAFDQEHFNFYGKTLRGQQEQKPRWKRVLSTVDGAVGEQLGQMYTEKYFTPEAKKRMLDLVNNLQSTYEERIKKLDWMSDSTKAKAIEKLNAFMKKIGYPDKWRNYDALSITRDNYAKNVLASNEFDNKFMLSKLGKPVDRTEWQMTPPTVNAYYNPAYNEIVFPAGILQFPFFDFNADDAAIYGAIGGVIGHEMTHGFDDQGAQYAADGNLKNWWSKEDESKFKQKTKVIIDQFNNYTVLNNVHVNGELTQGENAADLGGVTIAYDAFKKTKQGQSNDKIDGLTPDQRFFLSWAQVWRQNIRDEEQAQRIVTDPHSPGIHRCNGPLSNFEPFYTAFNVKPTNKMYVAPEKRAKIW